MSGYWHGLIQGLLIGLVIAWALLGRVQAKLLEIIGTEKRATDAADQFDGNEEPV